MPRELEPLDRREKSRLALLEGVIEEGLLDFIRVGNALLEIRESKLYREWGTFKEYMRERWHVSESQGYALMDTAYIADALKKTIGSNSFQPQNHWQLTPLRRLGTSRRPNPDAWAEAWKNACVNMKTVPTEKAVSAQVDKLLRKADVNYVSPEILHWVGDFETPGIYVADVTETSFYNSMPEDVFDLIVSDPPWEEEGLELYVNLGKLALKTLKPGRFLLAFLGKMFLVDELQVLNRYLDYAWTFCLYQPDSNDRINKWQLYGAWRPVAMFIKPPVEDRRLLTWLPDSMKTTRDKRYHRWGQGTGPIKYWIEKFTLEGELVGDFYGGGGMTPSSAQATNRNFLAFDKDPDAVKAMSARLLEESWPEMPPKLDIKKVAKKNEAQVPVKGVSFKA
jgi:hypothetical protein